MTVSHKNITDPNIHEPKGVASSSANTVYVSNGSGSGTWQKIGTDSINDTQIQNINVAILNTYIPNVSSASSSYVVSPFAGTVAAIYTALGSAITVADVIVTPKINGTPITNGGITVAYTGSAAGDTDTSLPTAANTITAGQSIEIAQNGGSTTSAALYVTVVINII